MIDQLTTVFVTLSYFAIACLVIAIAIFAIACMVIAIAIELFGLIDRDRKIPGTDADRHRRL